MACLQPIEQPERYHKRCLQELFGTPTLPAIEVELAKLHTLGLAMAGHTSISGVQSKISLGFSGDRATLQVAIAEGRYILKPSGERFPHLPENEITTMRLAEVAGIDIPPCALVPLKDGSLAYVVTRFDRTPNGKKLRQEDFCQLGELPPVDKYNGSAELCARLVRKYATEPVIENAKLFRRMVFVWLSGNGDMHLKNFSLLAGEDGLQRLSPAYDLVCSVLVIKEDQLSLPVGGKKDRLSRRHWLEYATQHCKVPPPAANRAIDEVRGKLPDMLALVARAPLPDDMKAEYSTLLKQRTADLAPEVSEHSSEIPER